MEDRKEDVGNNGWMSVPAFGDWDLKNGVPDYSMNFSKIRESRKMHKSDFSRASVGNDEELMTKHKHTSSNGPDHQLPSAADSSVETPMARKRTMSYFICCAGI